MATTNVFIELPQNGIDRVITHHKTLTFIPTMLVEETEPNEVHIKVWFKDKNPLTFNSITKEILLGNYKRTEKNTLRLTEYFLKGTVVDVVTIG